MAIGFNATCVLPGSFQPNWRPTDELWLRSDLGITLATGVSLWADQSGKGYNVAQATGALQPAYLQSGINGLPSIKPNGTSQYLGGVSSFSSGPLTCFIVAQETDQTAVRCAVSTADGLGFLLYSDSSTTMFYRMNVGGIDVTLNAKVPHVYGLTINGASSNAYLDGVAHSGTVGVTDTSAITVGAHQGGPSLFW